MEVKKVRKEYIKDDLTVVWQPHMCTHATKCWKGLGEVFNPTARPWINMDGASIEAIKKQVSACPSGALSYIEAGAEQPTPSQEDDCTRVEVMSNGPLLVYGKLAVKHTDGNEDSKLKVTAFCRCGASATKPYCDGAHNKVDFKG